MKAEFQSQVEQPEKVHFFRVVEKAKKILPYEEKRVNLLSFKDIYKEEAIRKDLETLERYRKEFEHRKEIGLNPEKTKTISDAFEIMLSDQIELNNWFGENVSVIRASEYDDFKNKIDAIVEFAPEESLAHLALAADFTYSRANLKNKLYQIRRDIGKGELATVKYFISEQEDFRGELNNIPKIVMGLDFETIDEVFDLWLRFKNLRKHMIGKGFKIEKALKEKIGGMNKQLQNHKIQIQLLRQLEAQLRKFSEFAEKIKNDRLAEKLKNLLQITTNILKEREKIFGEKVEESEFEKTLKKELEIIFQ